MIGLLLGLAFAGGETVAISVGGGYDLPTRQAVTALDLAVHPDQELGFAFVGRLRLGAGLADLRPLGVAELGFAGVVPAEKALIRLGLIATTTATFAPYALALDTGVPDGDFGSLGFLPGGMVLVEMAGFNPMDMAWLDHAAFGLRAGVGMSLGLRPCEPGEVPEVEAVNECIAWRGGPIGGFAGRFRMVKRLHVEVVIGPNPWLSVGVALGGARRGGKAPEPVPAHLRPDAAPIDPSAKPTDGAPEVRAPREGPDAVVPGEADAAPAPEETPEPPSPASAPGELPEL